MSKITLDIKTKPIEVAALFSDAGLWPVPIGQNVTSVNSAKATNVIGWNKNPSHSPEIWSRATGVGIMPTGRLIAVDRDCMEIEKRKYVDSIFPPSLVERFGNKNKSSTLFFEVPEGDTIPGRKDFNFLEIEILSTNHYCAMFLPFKGGDYYSIKNLDLFLEGDFPVFTKDIRADLEAANAKFRDANKNQSPNNGLGAFSPGRCRHGSHNDLRDHRFAMAKNRESIEYIIKKTLQRDKEINKGADFTYYDCPTRNWPKGNDRFENAKGEVETLNKSKNLNLPSKGIEEVTFGDFEDEEIDKTKTFNNFFLKLKEIQPQGEIARLQEQIVNNGSYERPDAVLLSLLGFYGNLSSHFRCYHSIADHGEIIRGQVLSNITSNLYTLDVVKSAGGKSSTFSFLNHFTELIPELSDFIKGRGGVSLAVMHENLALNPRPLYKIDEISSLFNSAKKPGNFAGLLEDLCSDFWEHTGVHSRDRRGESYGVCFNPRATIIGATTLNNFNEMISNKDYLAGIGRRLLINIDIGSNLKKRAFPSKKYHFEQIASLKNIVLCAANQECQPELPVDKYIKGLSKKGEMVFWEFGKTFSMLPVKMTDAANAFCQKDLLEIENMLVDCCPVPMFQVKFNSLIEITIKVALAYSLGRVTVKDEMPVVNDMTLGDVKWASNFVLRSFFKEYEYNQRHDKEFAKVSKERAADTVMESLSRDFGKRDLGGGVFIADLRSFKKQCKRKGITPLEAISASNNYNAVRCVRSGMNTHRVIRNIDT